MSLSIGMPVFNDARFLPAALDSILNQSFRDFELIISDDLSSDGSAGICQDYAARDPRIRYIRQPKNIGISVNMKFLLKEARGKYFMWAANDDLWDVDFISNLVGSLEKDPDSVVAFSPFTYIDEDSKLIEPVVVRTVDYAGENAFERIRKLTKIYDDGFGYGIFVREKILQVQFPRWIWPNQRCAYNNIYPSLYFYLTKGNFSLVGAKPLWFNRLKNNPHHSIPFRGHLIPCYFAFVMRKMNLLVYCLYSVKKAGASTGFAIRIFPLLFSRFAGDCWSEFRGQLSNFRQGKVKLF